MSKSAGDKRMDELKERVRHDSVGCMEEKEWKRKREELDLSRGESSIFKRSKLIGRSPPGGQEKEKWKMEKRFEELGEKLVEKITLSMEEMRESMIRKQEEMIKVVMDEMRRELIEQRREWREEKEELKKEIRALLNRVEKLEKGGIERGGEDGKNMEGDKMMEKMTRIKKKLEMREKEKRRNNIVTKRIEVKEGRMKEAAEGILKLIGAEVKVREIRRIGDGNDNGREMLVVKLENEDQKWEVMGKKNRLRGRGEIITEDLTWRERKIRWRLMEIAKKEEAKGNRAWVKGGRIRLEGKWWKWNEEEETLEEEGGMNRKDERGEK